MLMLAGSFARLLQLPAALPELDEHAWTPALTKVAGISQASTCLAAAFSTTRVYRPVRRVGRMLAFRDE
jgi:hypothetical protein